MKKAISLLAVFLVVVMWSASGFSADKYFSGNIGISWMSDTEIKNIDGPFQEFQEINDAELGFGSGLTLLGALGCDYGDYRVEGELGYQSNDVDELNAHVYCERQGEADLDVELDGDVTILSLLMNGYYDIHLGGGVELSPTVGVGIAQVSMDDVRVNSATLTCPNGNSSPADIGDLEDGSLDVNEVTFAYQAGIGLGIPVAGNIMLDARYRYFATTDFTMLAANTNLDSHSGLLGFRVMF
ncbi:outer membrane beta-barrel protein [Prosthecochloris sp.]|uniref:outer membrane protein n=1 Tax=Prosthecochloris sp. TaxID=290513 RepID=UPI0025CEEE72|nr:outer membrane beta-barrel protein [Prosthecochloris sp.]